MSKPDRLARELVDAAFELHRHRLWLEVPRSGHFRVRVQGEAHPLVVGIMGHTGDEYGLTAARGARALESVLAHVSGDKPNLEGLDLLSISMEPLGSLTAEMRLVLNSAGFQARREAIVPLFMTKPFGTEFGTRPSRSEQRILLAVVRGVLSAHDAGELRVAPFSAQPKRLLEITVEGAGRDVTARTREVGVEVRLKQMQADLHSVPDDLPRLDERWVAGIVFEAEEPRSFGAYSCFVSRESDKAALAHCSGERDDLEPIQKMFAGLVRGEWASQPRGLPRSVVVTDPRVYAVAAALLEPKGVHCELVEGHELIEWYRETVQIMNAALRRRDAAGAHDGALPSTLEEWKAADVEVTGELCRLMDEESKSSDRALGRYFGRKEIAAEVLSTLQQYLPLAAFLEWRMADYRATARSKTFLEKRCARKDLTPVERTLIEARMKARISIYRVVATRPAESLDVEDIFDGSRFTVHDRSLSGCDIDGVCLPLRLMRVGRWYFPVFAGPNLSAGDIEHAGDLLEATGVEFARETIQRHPYMLGWLFELLLPQNRPRIVLQNTDGDPLLWHTATFRLADPNATARALAAREDVDFDERVGTWRWVRETRPKAALGEVTVIAKIEIHDRQLVLEVNSEPRLTRARKWLEALHGGVEFERVSTRAFTPDPKDLPPDDRLPSKPEKPSPELTETLRRAHRDVCLRWLDTSVPALGNLSPRQAAKSAAGRRKVALMIRTLPVAGSPAGPLEPPREEMLRALGIAAGG